MSDPFKLPNFMINGNELVYLFDSHADALAGQQMIRDAVRRDAVNAEMLAALCAISEDIGWKYITFETHDIAEAAIARAKGEA